MPPPERLEVFRNNSYRLPPASDDDRAMVPAYEGDLAWADVPLDNGGVVRRARDVVALEVPDDADSWVVVRVAGGQAPFPLLSAAVTLDPAAESPDAFAVPTGGPPPFAVSNPIYVDGDGDGAYRAAFAGGASELE